MIAATRNPKSDGRNPNNVRNPRSESESAGSDDSDFGLPSDFDRRISDLTLWQLVDSAFPTGGFAHSSGLEAAWQQGEVRNRAGLVSYLEASLNQIGQAALPFVTSAWDGPERLDELDELCEVFTTNHVANRASRSQGRAFLTAVERVFLDASVPAISTHNGESMVKRAEARAPDFLTFAHFTPVFGACLRRMGVDRQTTARMFFFNHLRGVFAASVRLNIIGPMEAQMLQHRLSTQAEEVIHRCQALTLDDLAQTAPLLDLWQGAQDRLYSRLFQS
jgi:urease accessory protein